jgi:hypothetical protein
MLSVMQWHHQANVLSEYTHFLQLREISRAAAEVVILILKNKALVLQAVCEQKSSSKVF